MALKIDHPDADRLARELVTFTGETIPQAVVNALREWLAREKRKHHPQALLAEDLIRIGRECAALPILDARAPDVILGYDEHGISC